MTKISVTPEIEAALRVRAQNLGEDIEACAERILREALGRPNDTLPAPPPKQKQGNGDVAARCAEPHDNLESCRPFGAPATWAERAGGDPISAAVVNGFDEIVRITGEVFPDQLLSVEPSADPEYPETQYTVFRITAEPKAVDLGSLIKRELAWYQRVRQVIPDAVDSVRLLID